MLYDNSQQGTDLLNGLILAPFAKAARALCRDNCRMVAERDAEFLQRELRQENGHLPRTWKARPACPEHCRVERVEGAGKAKLDG
jgi:hypothetical protein